MTFPIYIWLLGGILLGGVCAFFIAKSLFSKEGNSGEKVDGGITESLKAKINEVQADSERKEKELKTKYETLIQEAKQKCNELDTQLKAALDGKIDDSVKEQLASIDKLNKKIKDLEEEIDENEDDISDLKKKVKNKDNDIAELQDNLASEKKQFREVSEELSKKQAELEETISTLNLKAGSLEFIQELLSAVEISTGDITTLNNNIASLDSFMKDRFVDINSYLYKSFGLTWNEKPGDVGFEEKKKFYLDAFDQWSATKRKSWLDNKTTIAFVGEFSAGKTSIVNRILSQDNPKIPQLPVSAKATTAIPTYIAGGPSTTYSFVAGDGKLKTILETTFKKVSKDILDQVKGVSSLIKYFVMTYNNPNLNGLSILDTPGFNSNDKEDKERTIEVINECDALFWVFDVNAGTVNRSSLALIKEKLHKPLYVVINKVDTKASTEVDKVEALIKKTLNDVGQPVEQFIRFSSQAPLSSIMDPIKAVNKISARDSFMSDVDADFKQILDIINNSVKDLDAAYNKAFQEGEQITNNVISNMNALRNACEEAYGIPQFKEGFKVFGIGSDDKFVMSIAQTNRLRNLLSNIADNRMNAIANGYDNRVSKAEEIQQAWSDLCDCKNAWQRVNDCYEQFKKLAKKFN